MGGTESRTSIDTLRVSDSQKWLIKVRTLLRRDFRVLFGLAFSNRWGFFIERSLTSMIHAYSYCVRYPRGNAVMKGHSTAVLSCAVSTHGCLLFTGSSDSCLICWDLIRMQKWKDWAANQGSLLCLDYHRTSILASAGSDSSVRLWNVMGIQHSMDSSPTMTACLKGHSERIFSVKFDHSGSLVASGSFDNTARVWDVRTGGCLCEFKGHSHSVNTVMFMDESTVISGGWDSCLRVWNIDDGEQTDVFSEGIGCGVDSIQLNSDSSMLLCCVDGGFRVLKWPSMRLLWWKDSTLFKGAFHPSVPHLLAAGNDGNASVEIWDTRNTAAMVHRFRGHRYHIDQMCFTPDGQRLVTVSSDRSVRVWDMEPVLSELAC